MCGIFAVCQSRNQPLCIPLFDLGRAEELIKLSIVDMEARQPIMGSNENQWLVHNGEIYNHMDLRDQLSNVRFRTFSDSEVILHLYALYRHSNLAQMFKMLDGVYSWALIYEDDFLVARDKIGVKQLYYGRNEVGSWFFASELKALEKECDGVVIDSFPAGHYFTPSKGIVPFWFPSWLHWEDTLNRPNYETIRSSLIDATHKRLMANVEIGALLSGGLDSSLICAIAAKQLKLKGLPKLKTYSIGLCDSSDGIAASKVANFIGSSHKHILFTVEEGLSMINKVIWHLETYDVGTVRAAIVHFLLSKAVASDNVKVVLSDELFGGYLYLHNAPSDEAFQKESIEKILLLPNVDCLRADKACMANGVEARVPYLDVKFVQTVMSVAPYWRRPQCAEELDGRVIEKYLLRKAFSNPRDPYLPDDILWKPKEQFDDGVGYNWTDGLKAHSEKHVTDEEMCSAPKIFPYNTPITKEGFFYRRIFAGHFRSKLASQAVQLWLPKWVLVSTPLGVKVNSMQKRLRNSKTWLLF